MTALTRGRKSYGPCSTRSWRARRPHPRRERRLGNGTAEVTPPAIANAPAPRVLGCHVVDPARLAPTGDGHAETLDRSEDAWSGAGFTGAVSADLQRAGLP